MYLVSSCAFHFGTEPILNLNWCLYYRSFFLLLVAVSDAMSQYLQQGERTWNHSSVSVIFLGWKVIKSQNTGLERTSRITWSNLSWQNHSVDKMAQHPTAGQEAFVLLSMNVSFLQFLSSVWASFSLGFKHNLILYIGCLLQEDI